MLEDSLFVGGLLVLGAHLKRALPRDYVRYIPLITWSVGIIVWCGVNGWDQWARAILVSAAATGVHSATKNTMQALTGKPVDSEKEDGHDQKTG